ncbi:MAG: ParB N-terminal domain-containing protein [Halobacteriovoraceae bacterium]|jgi:ParB family transcriptional regulator, chromosome partitioning protein|nr:ParB N-terminal domain-containing protein [Halobacteriovoraceae bacterium]MBT5093978.1 ParB N-terminal domain-containing protein [Halobacteriovoraceae bacterium]
METLNLDQIILANSYLRTETDIEALKKSIETVGLINPLTVNLENELLAGGRRYQALKELGISEVAIQRTDLSTIEQELISIDENLVRTPLNKIELEQCLNRGREIYEKINPSANKIETKAKSLTPAEKKIEKEEEENDTTSFAAITAEKTGLSKAVIKKAIQRDAGSSKIIKDARGKGTVSAGQVNEIIKLTKKEQELLLPHVGKKSVREVRKMVEQARDEGVDEAIRCSMEEETMPTEFIHLGALVKKCNKQLAKILVENIHVEGKELQKVVKQVKSLQKQSADFLALFAEDATFVPQALEEFEEASLQ